MRTFVATVLAATLFASTAFAATGNAPLAPGKPAGVKQADIEASDIALGIFFGAIAAGVIVLVVGTGHNGTTSANVATGTQ